MASEATPPSAAPSTTPKKTGLNLASSIYKLHNPIPSTPENWQNYTLNRYRTARAKDVRFLPSRWKDYESPSRSNGRED
jgi:hypothetical protein